MSNLRTSLAISAIIPTYREAATIENAVSAVASQLTALNNSYEIVVVDNASPDGTAEIAQALGGKFPLRVLQNEKNLGKGFSVRRGMLASRGKWRFFCDADMSTHPDEITKFWHLTNDATDILIGSRLASGADVSKLQPMPRRLAGRLMLAISHTLFDPLPNDIFCGFKWFRNHVADKIFSNVSSTGWVFDLEVLAIASQMGYTILEVPIKWENHEDTRLKMSREWYAIGVEVLKIKWRTRNGQPRSILMSPEHSSPRLR